MATTATKSKSTNGATRKPTASRSAKSGSAQNRSAAPRRSRNSSAIPGWAATVASVVGVGVAIGAGLFATRRQWLPQAERWGDQIASRFRHEEDDEFYGDSIADRDDDDSWDDTEKVSRAAYPDRDLYPGAQAVS